MIIKSTWASMY